MQQPPHIRADKPTCLIGGPAATRRDCPWPGPVLPPRLGCGARPFQLAGPWSDCRNRRSNVLGRLPGAIRRRLGRPQIRPSLRSLWLVRRFHREPKISRSRSASRSGAGVFEEPRVAPRGVFEIFRGDCCLMSVATFESPTLMCYCNLILSRSPVPVPLISRLISMCLLVFGLVQQCDLQVQLEVVPLFRSLLCCFVFGLFGLFCLYIMLL